MAACVSCGTRKGKRSCPALRDLICPRCCGTKRLVEIHCPADCRYLDHEEWQGERRLAAPANPFAERYRRASDGPDPLRIETLVLLDLLVGDFYRAHPDFPASALGAAMRFLRRLASPLETISTASDLLERWIQEKLALPLERGLLDRDELSRAADASEDFFGEHVRDQTALREYLRFVAAIGGDMPRRPWERMTGPSAEGDGSREEPDDRGEPLIVKP